MVLQENLFIELSIMRWHKHAEMDFIVVIEVQAGIDIMGIVTQVGPLGSVKRKSDNSELSRRDITMLDQRCVPGHRPADCVQQMHHTLSCVCSIVLHVATQPRWHS